MTRRIVRLLAVLGMLVATMVPVLAAAASGPSQPSTSAGSDSGTISIRVDQLQPLAPQPDDTLQVAGVVINSTSTDYRQVQVSLHLGQAVSSRTELHALRSHPVAQPLATHPQQAGDGGLAGGQTVPFTITVPVRQLQLAGAGVYPLQVTAVGFTTRDGFRDLATANTFLPYVPTSAATVPTPLAWLVPLSSAPTLTGANTLTDDSLAAQVAPHGRLSRLLAGVRAADVATATVDPEVLAAVKLMADGPYAVSIDGQPAQQRPASGAARDWLNALVTANNARLLGLPYADPDAAMLVHAGQRELLSQAAGRSAALLPQLLGPAASRIDTGIALAPDGQIDLSGAEALAELAAGGNGGAASSAPSGEATGTSGVVLSAAAVAPDSDDPGAAATVPGLDARLLLIDPTATDLATADPSADPRLAEQEFIAETAQAHLENVAASTGTTARTVSRARPLLIAPPRGWDPPGDWAARLLSDTAHLPWMQQVSVQSLLTSRALPHSGITYSDSAANQELPVTAAATAQMLLTDANHLDSAVVSRPDVVVTPLRDAALATTSVWWRDKPDAGTALADSTARTIRDTAAQVRVVASRQVTLTSERGRVPVTLENDLPAAVRVSLVLSTRDQARVRSGTIVTRTVASQQKVQVEVEVQAKTAGTFPVQLSLTAPDGSPLGQPANVLVRSTAFGVAALVTTWTAIGALVLIVAVRAIRAAWRRRAAQR